MKLIDWSRSQAGSLSVLASSRLHERQPGAIIFRKVEDEDGSDSGGAGRPRDADRRSAPGGASQQPPVPPAPGTRVPHVKSRTSPRPRPRASRDSTLSLAAVIGEAPFRAAFDPRIVISGSATAGENIQRMKDFSRGAIYRATVQPTAVLQERMARFLESLNPAWKDGDGVALLTESNTAFGGDAGKSGKDAATARAAGGARTWREPFREARSPSTSPCTSPSSAAMRPLLRSRAPSSPGRSFPLNMRETVPPSDF